MALPVRIGGLSLLSSRGRIAIPCTIREGEEMSYVEGFAAAVPDANRKAFRQHAPERPVYRQANVREPLDISLAGRGFQQMLLIFAYLHPAHVPDAE